MVMVVFKMESRGQILMEPRELAAGLDMESKKEWNQGRFLHFRSEELGEWW